MVRLMMVHPQKSPVKPAIKVGFANVNGIANKLDAIREKIKKFEVELLFLVETWVCDHQSVNLRNIVVEVSHPYIDGKRGVGGIIILAAPWLVDKVKVVKISECKKWCLIKVGATHFSCGYFAPRKSYDSDISFQLFMKEVSEIGEIVNELIILGDFNARLGDVSGDSFVNCRGRWLRTVLEDSLCSFELKLPVVGTWTTITYNGKGITDLVLEKKGGSVVNNLVVHEDDGIGASDHSLLTFEALLTSAAQIERKYIAFSKLKKVEHQTKLLDVLNQYSGKVMSECLKHMHVIHRASRLHKALFWDQRKELVDSLWSPFRNLLERSIKRVCGQKREVIHLHNDFMTPKLLKLQADLDFARIAARNLAVNDGPKAQIKEAFRHVGHLSATLNKCLRRRRQVVFRRSLDLLDLPDGQNEFVRLVSSLKNQNGRFKNALSSDKLSLYADHFGASIGAPQVSLGGVLDQDTLRGSDDTVPLVPVMTPLVLPDTINALLCSINNSFSTGVDGIAGLVLKLCVKCEDILDLLSGLFSACYTLSAIPADWKSSIIYPLYKGKGDKTDIGNYRPISLTSVVRRLYESIWLQHLTPTIDRALTDNQNGFRPNRGTEEALVIVHEMLLHNPGSCYAFMDFKSAYDTVDRRVVWSDLANCFKIDWDTIRSLRALFDHNVSMVRVENEFSHKIGNNLGLLQGSRLSPMLFNVFIHSLSVQLNRMSHVCQGPRFRDQSSNHVLFADDLTLMGRSIEDVQRAVDLCADWAEARGMQFNASKCSALISRSKSRDSLSDSGPLGSLVLNGGAIEFSSSTKFLGMMMNGVGIDWKASILARQSAAFNRIRWLHSKGFNAFGWRPVQSIKVYRMFIRPMLEYGLQLRILPKYLIGLLQEVQSMALRKLLSCGASCSRAALHLMCGMETMTFRNHLLNIKFVDRICSSSRKDRLIQVIVSPNHKCAGIKHHQCLINTVQRSNDWCHLSHIRTPDMIALMKERSIIREWKSPGVIYQRIQVLRVGQPSKFVLEAAEISRPKAFAILQWRLGRLGLYGDCRNCGESLSRSHFIKCGGIGDAIGLLCVDRGIQFKRESSLDVLLDDICNDIELSDDNEIRDILRIGTMLLSAAQGVVGWSSKIDESLLGGDDPDDPLLVRLERKKKALKVLHSRKKIKYSTSKRGRPIREPTVVER